MGQIADQFNEAMENEPEPQSDSVREAQRLIETLNDYVEYGGAQCCCCDEQTTAYLSEVRRHIERDIEAQGRACVADACLSASNGDEYAIAFLNELDQDELKADLLRLFADGCEPAKEWLNRKFNVNL